MSGYQCANCHEPIPEDAHPHTMKIELFPLADDPLEISEEDLQINFDEEIKKIVGQLEAMDEAETKLQEERVYSSFSFVLCGRCRDLLARQLRQNITAT